MNAKPRNLSPGLAFWPQSAGRRGLVGPFSMFSIVGLSFCCMIAGGLIGLEWTSFSGVFFSVAALAAIVFFSAIDAWECEGGASESGEAPAPRALNGARSR